MAEISGQTTDSLLGQEFLTWLWFQSEKHPDSFHDKEGAFQVSLEQRIVVQCGAGTSLETASISGSDSPMCEARLGLRTGKKVTRALIHFERDSLIWQLTVKADDFSLSGMKTPKVEKDEDDDPDALFLEKMYLTEICFGFFDACYQEFITRRLGSNWAQEVREIADWIDQYQESTLPSC